VFKQFTRQLKRKTSQVLRSLAEQLDQTPPDANVADETEHSPDITEEKIDPSLTSANPTTGQVIIQNLTYGEAEGEGEGSRRRVMVTVSPQDIPTEPRVILTTEPSSSPTEPTTPVSPSKSPRSRRRRRSPQPNALLNKVSTALAPIGSGLQQFRQHPRFWLLVGMGLGASSGAIALGWGIYSLEKNTQENIDNVLTYAQPGTLTIKAKDGKVLQEIGPVSHDQLKVGAIPLLVKQAFIASEDRRFNEHRGVDLQGITRALFSNLQAGEVREGGSTITQQLARQVFLNQDRNFGRKIRELRLAQKIEEKFSKEQILERYLNLVYLGSGAYGVADAAWAYFSKTPDQLTLTQVATLAGVVPAPSLYSPLENKETATQRRNEVLRKMQDVGFITQAQMDKAIAEPLVVKPSPLKRFERNAPYFTDYILQQLPKHISEADLKKGGVTVITTLNYPWQQAAQRILTEEVKNSGQWQRFSQGALVSIDPKTGAIKAMVGGKDYEKNQFNRVTQAKRQPGSTFKPILYSAAIASGISPNKTYLNAPFTIRGYTPENYGDKYTGEQMSLRQALTNSVNVVAVRLLMDVGWNPVINLARKMGIESKLEPTYSLALGAWEVTPLEMTSAYTTFPNKGVHVRPFAIQQVLDAKGSVIYQNKLQSQVALDPDSTAIMISLMRSVVTSGTGRPAQLSDRQVAGKTGTSDKARDLWFIGYIPQLVTGVWLGNDNGQPTKGASATSALIWGNFMREAVKGMPVKYFPPLPKNLENRKPTIKAEPLKGHKIIALAIPSAPSGNTSQLNSTDDTSRSRRRSRRRRSLETANADSNSNNNNSSSTRRRRRRSVETASNESSSPRRSRRHQSSAQSSSPSVSNDNGLPAPPAARKSE
jgi:penicillin-binding protein 1A